MSRLQTRIMLLFTVLLLLFGGILGLTVMRSAEDMVIDTTGKLAMRYALQAAAMVDRAEFAKLTPESGETEYYGKLRAELNTLRETAGLKYLYTLTQTTADGTTVYNYVVDGAPAGAAEGEFSALGDTEENQYPGMVDAFATGKTQLGDLSRDEYGATVTAYVPIEGEDDTLIGVVGADYDATDIYELMTKTRTFVGLISAGMLAVALVLAYVLSQYLVGPLRRLTEQTEAVRRGELSVAVETGRRSDEIGQLSSAFAGMVDQLRVMMGAVRDSSGRLLRASDELSREAAETTAAGNAIAETIGSAAEGSSVQRRRAAETSRFIREMTGGMARIAASAGSVADNSRATAESLQQGEALAQGATVQMEAIGVSTGRMSEAARRLAERSGEIAEIVLTIRQISSQTNLLALNAAIESARAGEAGRGFAVVANEVRKLANQSEESAERIAGLIAAVLEETADLTSAMESGSAEVREGEAAVRAAGDTFRRMLVELKRIDEQVHEVSEVSRQVAAGSAEVASSVAEVEEISRLSEERFQTAAGSSTQQLAAMVRIAESSDALRLMAAELKAVVDRFGVK